MSSSRRDNPLALSPTEMRRLGHAAIDQIVDHLAGLGDKPVTRGASAAQAAATLGDELQAQQPTAPRELIDWLGEHVFAAIMHLDHPRFLGYIPGPSSFLGLLGELLAAGHNVYGGTWLESSSVTQLEVQAVRYLARACGLPAGASGIFLSGGSLANLSALAVARHQRFGAHDPRARVYCSAETHSSVAKALRLLGFADEQLRLLAVDADDRLEARALAAALEQDRAAGLEPLALVANAGTTSSGAVDPLPELAKLCEERGLWMHVDAAYGGAVALSPSHRRLLTGLERADSIAIDPHKWLFQPYGIGCLLVRDERPLRELFAMRAGYLTEMEGEDAGVNLFDLGPELTRPSRGLRLWFTLRAIGEQGMAAAIDRGFENAERAARLLEADGGWEVLTARLGIVTFRRRVAEADNAAIVEQMIAEGEAMVSATTVQGEPALRLCPINPATTEEDLRRTVAALSRAADASAAS
jgi:aromatic-L-amino-acid decarboxylase